jgi:ATP-binding cassette subfamily B protein RaxB
MVAAAHGADHDLPDLRRRFPVSLKGANLRQLVAHAAALNFASRPLRLALDELGQLQRPCILHWGLNHFVVLKQAGRRHVVILDPAIGERRLSLAEASRHFTGVALELTPNADFQPVDARPRLKLSQLTGRVRCSRSSQWPWCSSSSPLPHRCSTRWWSTTRSPRMTPNC